MNRFRRIAPVSLLALVSLASCGLSVADTPAALLPAGAGDTDDTGLTDAETTAPGSTDPDDTGLESTATETAVTDPARREWLEFAADADPDTYAGGASSIADLALVEALSSGRVDLTIGSALDLFGGTGARYADAVAFNQRRMKDEG